MKKILGIPITLFVIGLLVIGIATAALLNYYGVIKTTVGVQQSITLDGMQCTGTQGGGCTVSDEILETVPGGEEFCFLHKIRNDASVDIEVSFETTSNEQITTTIYTVPEETTLTFEDKDPNTWVVIPGGKYAVLTFDPVNPSFKGTLTTNGLVGDYALIYYPDQEDRFDPAKWNGAGGLVIATFTGDVTNMVIDLELNMNLPNTGDWNINPVPDYCFEHNGFDSYDHCKGAKLWIVKTSDLSSGTSLPLINWNPTEWLFEEDLITYSDCDEPVPVFAVDMITGAPITTLNTKTRTTTPILICYDFDVAIMFGEYTITTNIAPI